MEPSELPMPIPTIDDLTQRLGFRPPDDLVRLIKLAHELDPEGGYDGLEIVGLMYFDDAFAPHRKPDEWDGYREQPVECFRVASSGTAGIFPVIIADDPDTPAADYPFACFSFDQQVFVYGLTFHSGLASYIHSWAYGLEDLDDERRTQYLSVMAAMKREFGITVPRTDPDDASDEGDPKAIAARLARPGIHPTADGAGALVPDDKTDRAYLKEFQDDRTRRNKLPRDEQGVAVQTILAKARDRLNAGESGTALVVARDLWQDFCGGESPESLAITQLLIDAYTALDRPLLARRARARMDWVIKVDREFEERRKRREREQPEN